LHLSIPVTSWQPLRQKAQQIVGASRESATDFAPLCPDGVYTPNSVNKW
jgi:hypothetical protein